MSLKIGIRIRLDGIDRRIEQLKRVDALAEYYADIAVKLAKRYVRVDTGALQNSIRKEIKQTLKTISIRILAGEGLPDKRAYYNEYGTSRMPAQSYIRAALRQIRPFFLEDLRKMMK